MTDDIKHPRHPHPMQPIVNATDGVIRFQSNKIVEFIADILCTAKCGGALVTEDGKRITYNALEPADRLLGERAPLAITEASEGGRQGSPSASRVSTPGKRRRVPGGGAL